MKKAISLLFISAILAFGGNNLYAQDEESQPVEATTEEAVESTQDTTAAEEAVVKEETVAEEVVEETAEVAEVDKPFTQVLKEKFIEGGAFFMSFVLLALVLGLALVVERVLYLTFSMSNEKKLHIEPGAVYSRQEAAEALGISLSTLKRLIKKGHLTVSKPAGMRRVFITGESIQAMLNQTKVEKGA